MTKTFKRCLAVGAVLVVVMVGGTMAGGVKAQGQRVCLDDDCVHVEVMRTPQELQRGLQHRTTLANDQGMLFIFEESRLHYFWMKETLIPLDMIWLDADFRILYVESNVPPCQHDPCPTYGLRIPARYVLEVNAGFAQAHHFIPGQQLSFHQ